MSRRQHSAAVDRKQKQGILRLAGQPARPSGSSSRCCSPRTYLSLATTSFDTPRNLFNITRNFTFFAIIAMGMTIVIITGGIDLRRSVLACARLSRW